MDYSVTEKTVRQSLYVNVGHYQAKFLPVSMGSKFYKNIFLRGKVCVKAVHVSVVFFLFDKVCQVSKLLNYEWHYEHFLYNCIHNIFSINGGT